MTQQQVSRLLDVPERTLRDWKKNRHRLYELLVSLEYQDVKGKIGAVDSDDIIVFDPKKYSHNLFWQTNRESEQKVYTIISKYLSTLNIVDIKILCDEFGKNLVRSVLEDRYKRMYKKGYIAINGIDIPLQGSYRQDKIYKQLLGIINDC